MYQFSRAIYRELAPHILPPQRSVGACLSVRIVLYGRWLRPAVRLALWAFFLGGA